MRIRQIKNVYPLAERAGYDASGASLLILGASARAAAQSAARLGLRPYCGDLFCDADLPDSAVGQVARSFPGDLVRIAGEAPPGPWMYTGGLENYPAVVARVTRRHELLGTAPDALRRVRDPFELSRVLQRTESRFPETRTMDGAASCDGSWLIKHRRSSGGLRVATWRGQPPCASSPGWYLQRRVEGLPVGAVFLAAHRRAQLLGMTAQLLTGSGRRPFQYRGSIGPVELSVGDRQSVVDLGRVLAAEFDLRGLFGVDLIVAADGVWPIEVNPRYTASVEVLERAFGVNAIEMHFAACRNGRLSNCEMRAQRYVGKSIMFAERPCEITAESVHWWLAYNDGQVWPAVADSPRAGTRVEAGRPLLTVMADGPDITTVQQRLWERIQAIRHKIGV